MKNLFYLSLACLFFLFSCKKDDPVKTPDQENSETISGVINESMTLKADVKYLLKGQVYVKNNSVLTIPAGVTIEVEKVDDPASKSALIITKGSKLVVSGTSDLPVVFTSAAASKAAGDWIGIIVLGRAPTNLAAAHISGLPSSADTEFGSTISDDNSGSLQYLRIEYSGGLNPAQEEEWAIDMASGLSLMGVGSGTLLEHVMVSNSRDDGFQFVGGTVNGKYLVSYNNVDDDFDFDRGYRGKLQFLLGYKKEHSTIPMRAHGMESLNDIDASPLEPYTRPVISNMTIMGPPAISTDLSNLGQGIYIRKNTRFYVRNSIVAGYCNGGLMLCPKTKPLLIKSLGSQFKYNLVNSDVPNREYTYDNGGAGLNVTPDAEIAAYAAANQNTTISPLDQLHLKSLSSAYPNLTPEAEAPALSGANFDDAEYDAFFMKVSFRGAIGTDNWTIGNWTNWK
jgi:hypothetical protein